MNETYANYSFYVLHTMIIIIKTVTVAHKDDDTNLHLCRSFKTLLYHCTNE